MTQSNLLQTAEIPAETINTRRKFWGTIALSGILTLLGAYFINVFLQQPKTLVIYGGIVMFLGVIVASAISFYLTVRNRQALGIQILFIAMNLLGVMVSGLFQGRTPTSSLSILALSALVILWLLPNQTKRLYSVVAAAAFILTWVIEWINPAWRINITAVAVGPFAGIVFAMILVAVALRQSWAYISLRWKIGSVVAILLLSTIAIAYTGYSGLQSLKGQLSNIYDFMLVPIVSINNADSALADAQIKLENLDEIKDSEKTGYITAVNADNKITGDIITRYNTEWVTTTSPEFTEALRQGGKLELQQQEVATLEKFHTAFNLYLSASQKYIQSIQAGQASEEFATQAIQSLQNARASLQELIAINNQFADFSNTQAQLTYRSALINAGVVLGLSLLIGSILSYLIVASIISRLGDLTQFAATVQNGNLTQRIAVIWNDEISLLGNAFNDMTSQLQASFTTLEQRVADRTHNLELAAEVGRAVSQVRNLDVMLKDACNLILKEFDLYYVQVYLTDPYQTKLILEAGTGDVAAQLIERGHSLPIDINSINGRAAVEKSSVLISDTLKSATFRQNPLLPETRGEMAVPLIVADKVVGVLDMQSRHSDVLTKEILPAFEALAGQLAVAIHNASLLAETEVARAEVEKQARRLMHTGWNDYLDAIHKPEQIGYVFDHNQVASLAETDETQPYGASISAPIAVTGEPLGSLVVEVEDEARAEQMGELVNIVSRQVAQQIENLRLLESAERYRAEVEKVNRLATAEGWKKYMEERSAESLGYLYDLKDVKPYKSDEEQFPAEQVTTLPLKVHDETIGKIAIQGIRADDTESLSLANDVADRLSAHIESMRQFAETKRGQVVLDQRARQLAAVAEVSTASSRELDIQKMLEMVVFLTQRRFGLYHAHIFTYSKHTDNLSIAACGWKEGDEHEGTHGATTIPLTQEQSLVARAGRTLEVVISNDVNNEPGWLPNPLLPDTKSEMAIPLVIGGQMLGVLDVQSDKLNAFSAEEASIYTTLASQVATALQNAKSFARAQQQAEREAKLNLISQKIQSATSVEAVLQIAARELGHALGAPRTIAQLSLKNKK